MKNIITFLLLATIIILSASSCEQLVSVFNSSSSAPQTNSNNHISFLSPKVDQESRYVLYKMENAIWDTDNMTCQSYADTLVLKIISYDKVHYFINETLSEGSTIPDDPSLSDWLRHMMEGDGVTYLMRVVGDSIYFSFPNGWSALYHSPQTPLPLVNITTNMFDLNPCNAVSSPGTSEGYTVNYKYENSTYPHLNIIVNTVMMAVDGPGYVHIYSSHFGLVNAYSMNPWKNDAVGWQLIE